MARPKSDTVEAAFIEAVSGTTQPMTARYSVKAMARRAAEQSARAAGRGARMASNELIHAELRRIPKAKRTAKQQRQFDKVRRELAEDRSIERNSFPKAARVAEQKYAAVLREMGGEGGPHECYGGKPLEEYLALPYSERVAMATKEIPRMHADWFSQHVNYPMYYSQRLRGAYD